MDQPVRPAGSDAFGIYFEVPLGPDATALNYILHRGDTKDLPADQHSRGCNLAFADGHTAHWRWRAPKIFTGRGQDISGPQERKDFERLQATLRPEYRFK